MPSKDSRPKQWLPQVSVRSLLLVMTGAALLCFQLLNNQLGDRIRPYQGDILSLLSNFWVSLVVYFAAWIVPAMSIGYDNRPSAKGLAIGAVIGYALAAAILDALS